MAIGFGITFFFLVSGVGLVGTGIARKRYWYTALGVVFLIVGVGVARRTWAFAEEADRAHEAEALDAHRHGVRSQTNAP